VNFRRFEHGIDGRGDLNQLPIAAQAIEKSPQVWERHGGITNIQKPRGCPSRTLTTEVTENTETLSFKYRSCLAAPAFEKAFSVFSVNSVVNVRDR
jgi:hypothetical protein